MRQAAISNITLVVSLSAYFYSFYFSKMLIKLKYSLLCLLVLGTATLTTTYWHLGMAGITTFLLAYFSKGMRRYR